MNGQNPLTNGHSSPVIANGPAPLKIIIVGAGIGGLFAAISLRTAGHDVEIFESSRFAVETGAAIHLPSNVNGLLRRYGIIPEKHGAVNCERVTDVKPNGEVMYSTDVRGLAHAFAYPWQLCHRIDLHNALKEAATSKEGKGKPATIHLQSRVESVDCETATVTLKDGRKVQGDLVLGADGVHSVVRKDVLDRVDIPHPSGTSAFRFLIPTSEIKADPKTAHFAEYTGELRMLSAQDRRLVLYPCRNNTEMNFVGLHPDSESGGSSEEWNQSGSIDVLLKVFDGYSDDVKALLKKAQPDTVKLWKLLDHEALPFWTKGRVALLGDAAHPFLPHQGQGGAQAMEDSAALGALLPLGTTVSDIPDRLKLYTECRYERATIIQSYSRSSGFQAKVDNANPKAHMNHMQFTGFNFDHDAHDHASGALKRYRVEKSAFKRMPISFGPCASPRQNLAGKKRSMNADARYHTSYMTFKTRKSYLQTLMPTRNFSIEAQGGWTTATFSITKLDNLKWLGGRGYSHFGLYIHNVVHKGDLDANAQSQLGKSGDLLPVLFENMADPIITGREELGFSKVFATLESKQLGGSYSLTAGWEGTSFCEMMLEDLVPQADAPPAEEPQIFHHKLIPSSTVEGGLDAQYTTVSNLKLGDSSEKRWKASSASISFTDLEGDELERAFPTLANIIEGLRQIEVSEVVESGIRSSV